MDMQKCTIYLRMYKRKTIQGKSSVSIGEIADVSASPTVKANVEAMKIFFVVEPHKNGRFNITIIQVIDRICKQYPNADIQSVGDPDTVLVYEAHPVTQHNIYEWIKVTCVSIIVFAGAFIAIMTYNTDTSIGKTFGILNQMLTGDTATQAGYITIPYSIGIMVGVIIFFNHVGFKKITDDPTPMQIEMKDYEKRAEDCEIESIADKRRGEP